MKTRTVGILNVDGTKTLKTVADDFRGLQECVGGNIESVFIPHFKGQVYVNEEGLLRGMPRNPWCEKIGHPHLVGPIVAYFSGRDCTEADLEKLTNPSPAALKRMRSIHAFRL